MGCCSSQQYSNQMKAAKAGSKLKRNFSQLPPVNFISVDCNSIVNIAARQVQFSRIEQNELKLTRNCATVVFRDSLFILSGGIESAPAFIEITKEGYHNHPTPDIPTIGGMFIVNDQHLLLVGAKIAGEVQGTLLPGLLLKFNTERKRWSIVANLTSHRAREKSTIHPCLLNGAGACLRKFLSETSEPRRCLLFVGGEYSLNGKLVSNDRVLWLDLDTSEFGTYSAILPHLLRNPHIVTLADSPILIVAGGAYLSNHKKSKRILRVDLESEGTVSMVSTLKHPLATSNICPKEFSEYIVFFSWPRVAYLHKQTKVIFDLSLRKSQAYKASHLVYSSHNSMGSDASSAEELDGAADSKEFIDEVLSRAGSNSRIGIKKEVKQKIEERKASGIIGARPTDVVLPRHKVAEPNHVAAKRSSSSSSNEEGKVRFVSADQRKSYPGSAAVPPPVKEARASVNVPMVAKGSSDGHFSANQRSPSSSIQKANASSIVPGEAEIGLLSPSNKPLLADIPELPVKMLQKKPSASFIDNSSKPVDLKRQVYKEDVKIPHPEAKDDFHNPAVSMPNKAYEKGPSSLRRKEADLDSDRSFSSNIKRAQSEIVSDQLDRSKENGKRLKPRNLTVSSHEESKHLHVEDLLSVKKPSGEAVRLELQEQDENSLSSSSSENERKLDLEVALKCNELLAEEAGFISNLGEFADKLLQEGEGCPSLKDLELAIKVSIPPGTLINCSAFPQIFSKLADYMQVNPLNKKSVEAIVRGGGELSNAEAVKATIQGLKRLLKQK